MGYGIQPRKDKRRKLTDTDIIAIYIDEREQFVIAQEYGISSANVSLIKSGKRHASVTSKYAQSKDWDSVIEKEEARVRYYAERHDEATAKLNTLLNQRASDPSWIKVQEEKREYQERKRQQRKEEAKPDILSMRPSPFYMPMPEEIGGYGDRD